MASQQRENIDAKTQRMLSCLTMPSIGSARPIISERNGTTTNTLLIAKSPMVLITK